MESEYAISARYDIWVLVREINIGWIKNLGGLYIGEGAECNNSGPPSIIIISRFLITGM